MSVPAEADAEVDRVVIGDRAGIAHRLLGGLRDKNIVALLDQAVTSGANFAAVVIVGRAAGADSLGVYSLGFTLLMLVSAAQESLVSSPYTFYGHQVDDDRRKELAGSSLIHALGLMVLASILLAVVAVAMGDSPLAKVLWVLSATTPFLLAREFARKFAFADLRIHVALTLDALASSLQIGGLLLLADADNLTAVTAFLASGLACGVAGACWLLGDRKQLTFQRGRIMEDWRNHWRFGRWVFAGVVTILLHINVVRWLIAFGIDNASAGVYAACMAIAMLSTPFIQGMNNVLMPKAAKAFHRDGATAVARIVWKTTMVVLSGMAVFTLLTFTLGGWAVTMIYGAEYAGHHVVICLLVLFMVSRAIDTSLYNGIWALERPDANVRINLVALTATVILSATLMNWWGIVGAAAGLLLGDVCGSVLRGWTFLALVGENATAEPTLKRGAE